MNFEVDPYHFILFFSDNAMVDYFGYLKNITTKMRKFAQIKIKQIKLKKKSEISEKNQKFSSSFFSGFDAYRKNFFRGIVCY